MRISSLALAPLFLVAAACSDDLATAPAADGGAAAVETASNAVSLPFRGTLASATHVAEFDPGTFTYFIDLVGTGTATHLGRFTLHAEYALNPATGGGPEQVTLTAANGDQLTAEGTVQGTPSGDGHTLTSVETLTITGGTGRFEGATGELTLRQVNLAPDRESSGEFEGWISFAR